MSAFLIGQLSKNYANGYDREITGNELMDCILETIKDVQYRMGGVVTFLEAESKEKLLMFYKQNLFQPFDTRQMCMDDSRQLVQLLRLI